MTEFERGYHAGLQAAVLLLTSEAKKFFCAEGTSLSSGDQEAVPLAQKNSLSSGLLRTTLPKDFLPSDAGRQYCEQANLLYDKTLEKFRNFHHGKGTKSPDWDSMWRSWIDKAKTMPLGAVDRKRPIAV